MTTAMNTTPAPLEDALYALSLGARMPTASMLDELVRRYPDYAKELTEAAISIVLDVINQGDIEEFDVDQNETSPAVSRAMSHFHNRIYAFETATKLNPSPKAVEHVRERSNPFATRNKEDARELAQALGINVILLIKMRDRLIAPETIPIGFIQFASEKTASNFELLSSHFAGPPAVALGAQYKAERKPEARHRQSFEEAVRTSGMTNEQIEALLKL